MVICCNPGAAARDAAVRGQFLTWLQQMTGGSGALSAAGRAGAVRRRPDQNLGEAR
jgi:hypothetical protein